MKVFPKIGDRVNLTMKDGTILPALVQEVSDPDGTSRVLAILSTGGVYVEIAPPTDAKAGSPEAARKWTWPDA